MTNITRKLATLAGILFVTMALGCASTAKQEGTGEYVDDTVITGKVKSAILNEPTLKSAEINVETFKGVVQLSGFVSSRRERKHGDAGRARRRRCQVRQERHALEVTQNRVPHPGRFAAICGCGPAPCRRRP